MDTNSYTNAIGTGTIEATNIAPNLFAGKQPEEKVTKKDLPEHNVVLVDGGNVMALYVTHESHLHHDMHTGVISFTDVDGIYVEWKGSYLFTKGGLKLNDRVDFQKKHRKDDGK